MTPTHLLPAPPGFPPRQRPAGALEALVGQLRSADWSQLRSADRFYTSADAVLGVLPARCQHLDERPGALVAHRGR